MKPLGLSQLTWLVCVALAACASHSSDAGYTPPERPPADQESLEASCARAGAGGSPSCFTSEVLLATPQLREAIHDLRRLGLVTTVSEVGHARLELALGDEALAPGAPLAYHLEHLYATYRNTYDLRDAVVLELWRDGAKVGTYTYQGLLLR